MSGETLNVLGVVGSLNRDSITRVAITHFAKLLAAEGCAVNLRDLLHEPVPIHNPDSADDIPEVASLAVLVSRADVFLLGTPDYHGGMSGAMKNFLDHFWREFAGKLFVTIVASHEKGLTVTDQLRTVARQCYAWTLPYGLSLEESLDVKDGEIVEEKFRKRLAMAARDTINYGTLLARQRAADLAGNQPGFMARHR